MYVQLFAYKKLTRMAWDILSYLTENTEANRWQISQETNRSYSSVHETIKKLIDYKLVQITKMEPSKKNPKIEVEYYGLTKIGLLHTLTLRGPSDIDKIAETHRDKLLFFKKWHLIEDNRAKRFIAKEFIAGLHEVLNTLWSNDYLKSKDPDLFNFDEKNFEEDCFRDIETITISRFVTYAYNLMSTNTELFAGEPKQTLISAKNTVKNLLNDPEFNLRIKQFIEGSLDYHTKEYNYYKSCLEKISEI